MKNRTFCAGLFLFFILFFLCGFFSNDHVANPSKTEFSYQDKEEELCFDIIPNNSTVEFRKDERTEERARRRCPAVLTSFKIGLSTTYSGIISRPFIYHAVNKYTYLFYSSVKTTAPPKFSS